MNGQFFVCIFFIFVTTLSDSLPIGLKHPPSRNATGTGMFLHITDIHLDPFYLEGAAVENDCHYLNPSSTSVKAGKYGAPLSRCDAPPIHVDLTFKTLQSKFRNSFDFIIWTGDNVRHDYDRIRVISMSEIEDLNRNVADRMRRAFPDIPLLPSIGNNDVYPHDQLSFTPNKSHPILDFFADVWSDMIPPGQTQGFKIHGNFYKDLIPGQVLGVSLNSLYMYNLNRQVGDCFFGTTDEIDSNNAGDVTLNWLKQTLRYAQERGYKSVYISGHVPPNTACFRKSCFNAYSKVVQSFGSLIQAQLFGHMNIDHFSFPAEDRHGPGIHKKAVKGEPQKELPDFGMKKEHLDEAFGVMDPTGRRIPRWVSTYFYSLMDHYRQISSTGHRHKIEHNNVGPILASPSVVAAFNPSFRVFHYINHQEEGRAGVIGALQEYDQYVMDLETWNGLPEPRSEPKYQLAYKTRIQYALPNLTSKSWKTFARRLSVVHPAKNTPFNSSEAKELQLQREILIRTYLGNLVVGVKEVKEIEIEGLCAVRVPKNTTLLPTVQVHRE